MTRIDRYEIDGVKFWGRPDYERGLRAGAYLLPDGVQGWRGGVSVRAEDVPRASADGSFATPGRLSARTSAWKALVLAGSDWALGEWEDVITGIGGHRGLFPVVGEELGRTLTSRVRIAETPTFIRRRGRLGGMVAAETEFQLVHPDPFLYGLPVRTGLSDVLTVRVPGTVESWSTITVAGANAPYTITGGGCTFVMSVPLSTRSTDVIDTASMSVLRNGVRLPAGFVGTIAPAPRKEQPVTYSISAGLLSAVGRPRFL